MIDKDILECLPYKEGEVLDFEFPVIDESKLIGYKFDTLYLKKELQNISNFELKGSLTNWKPSKSCISLKLLAKSFSSKEWNDKAEKLFNDLSFSSIPTEYISPYSTYALNLYLDMYDFENRMEDGGE